jgi:arsenate reductase
MSKVSIYHNPRCSKSRQTLKLLQEQGIQPDIIEYLKTPPSADELKTILKALSLDARGLMRTKEAIYKELELASEEDEQALVDAMVANPKLIERPIVINGDKVTIGRPPENVLKIL